MCEFHQTQSMHCKQNINAQKAHQITPSYMFISGVFLAQNCLLFLIIKCVGIFAEYLECNTVKQISNSIINIIISLKFQIWL